MCEHDGRCIPALYECDGHDHCGDLSDETVPCGKFFFFFFFFILYSFYMIFRIGFMMNIIYKDKGYNVIAQ